jgi:hypothetical protein
MAKMAAKYPGVVLGNLSIDTKSYVLFSAVKDSDGSLMLPTTVMGGALYNNTIWIHRLWRSGWLNIEKGDLIVYTSNYGHTYYYKVMDSVEKEYGNYMDGGFYIATCYQIDGEWAGVVFYRLQYVSIAIPQ